MHQSDVTTAVAAVLSREWQTRTQLEKKLKEHLKKAGVAKEPTDAQIYIALRYLEDDKLVEKETIDVPKSLGRPHGKKTQYRLGPGRRRGAQRPSPAPSFGTGGAVPQGA